MTVLVLVMAGCGGDEPAPVVSVPSPSASVTPSITATPTPTPTTTTSEPVIPTQTPSPAEPTTTQPTKAPPTEAPAYDGPPRTYDEAVARFEGAGPSQELSRFASPSGNLYCVLDSPYLPPSCELGRGAIPDAAVCPADGPSQSVGRIEFSEAGPQPVCNSDTIREPDAPVLGYGGVATWPDTTVTCVLERSGITCIDPAVEQGYFLARGRYQLF